MMNDIGVEVRVNELRLTSRIYTGACVYWCRDNVVIRLGAYDIEYNVEDNMPKIIEFDNVDRVLWDRMCVGSMMLNRSGGVVNIIEVAIVEQWSRVNKSSVLRSLCGNP